MDASKICAWRPVSQRAKGGQGLRLIILPVSACLARESKEACLKFSSMPARLSARRPAGPVWVAIWGFWPKANVVSQPPTAILSVVWGIRNQRFIWPVYRWPVRLPSRDISPVRRIWIKGGSRYEGKGKVFKYGANVDTDVIIRLLEYSRSVGAGRPLYGRYR